MLPPVPVLTRQLRGALARALVQLGSSASRPPRLTYVEGRKGFVAPCLLTTQRLLPFLYSRVLLRPGGSCPALTAARAAGGPASVGYQATLIIREHATLDSRFLVVSLALIYSTGQH